LPQLSEEQVASDPETVKQKKKKMFQEVEIAINAFQSGYEIRHLTIETQHSAFYTALRTGRDTVDDVVANALFTQPGTFEVLEDEPRPPRYVPNHLERPFLASSMVRRARVHAP
jgi:hypothetical protein